VPGSFRGRSSEAGLFFLLKPAPTAGIPAESAKQAKAGLAGFRTILGIGERCRTGTRAAKVAALQVEVVAVPVFRQTWLIRKN
jgi:hypothetical protein